MKYLTTALLLALASPASSQSAEVKRACDAVNMLAPLVMEQRQAGAAKAEILPYAQMAQGPVIGLVERMIEDAYAQPAADSASARQNAATQFQQKWVADCYASFR